MASRRSGLGSPGFCSEMSFHSLWRECTGVRKRLYLLFLKNFLWPPAVILESFIYQKFGKELKVFFLPYKDSIWAPFVTRQISRR